MKSIQEKIDGLTFAEFCDNCAEDSMIMSDDTPSSEWFIKHISEEWKIPFEAAKIGFEAAIKRLWK